MNHESFAYLWYDAPNKKYYLGKHKGSPDDGYTHSSTVWESFTKNNIPKGVRRRILAYGTDEEMSDLEVRLLTNRKKRCWDRYYNVKWSVRPIGDVKNILSEEGVKLWKERISRSIKGIPKPQTSAALKKFHESITDEERKQKWSMPLDKHPKWKGGISLNLNIKNYQKDKLKAYQDFGIKLLNEGYSYDEIKSKYPAIANKLPWASLPREEKDRRNKLARDRYKNVTECYCRKITCDFCLQAGHVLSKEEKKRRLASLNAKRYEKLKNDPVWAENKRRKDREKYANDPVWAEKRRRRERERQRRKKMEKKCD